MVFGFMVSREDAHIITKFLVSVYISLPVFILPVGNANILEHDFSSVELSTQVMTRSVVTISTVIHVDSKGFSRWWITHRITGFWDFFHRPEF
jgi:hypothetical protein